MGNLNNPSNVQLINKVGELYAKFKTGLITKSQYDYQRKVVLDTFKTNLGPFEKMMFGKNSTHQSIRIASAGGIPATAHIAKHANRLKALSAASKAGGIVLVGVGLTAGCMQIAKASSFQGKNEIFVETITSTTVGILSGLAIGVYLISNPIGWGTAIVLAIGSTSGSFAPGKFSRFVYTKSGSEIDLVSGAGINGVCK